MFFFTVEPTRDANVLFHTYLHAYHQYVLIARDLEQGFDYY